MTNEQMSKDRMLNVIKVTQCRMTQCRMTQCRTTERRTQPNVERQTPNVKFYNIEPP
jgi:hypothetical protein